MSPASQSTPDWDLEQLEVIIEDPGEWQLVTAGPGAGKSAVACQRVAFLVDEGVPPSRILLVSFTRTAVAELRDRIVTYAVAGEQAKSVRISTIDSHAWSLRSPFDDKQLPSLSGTDGFDLSIERTVELFLEQEAGLMEFMQQLEHFIVDEAQDVMGPRADLIMAMLDSLSESCGVTMLADPAQAIYGFTTDSDDQPEAQTSLLERLESLTPRALVPRRLSQNHRIQNEGLVELFLRTRKAVEAEDGADPVAGVQEAIRETCGEDVGVQQYSDVAAFLSDSHQDSMLVLFRRRADVLFASSYCSEAEVEHRLRMSGLPVVVHPWIGWLFGDVDEPIMSRTTYEDIWEDRTSRAAEPFEGVSLDGAWTLLHRLAAGKRTDSIDLITLRRLIARSRPPLELCSPELGTGGPILGTIHASKGREADTVVLVMPPPRLGKRQGDKGAQAAATEEGRVYYVGATRARKMLFAGKNSSTPVASLESRRIYRKYGQGKAQLEVGRSGDVDYLAPLAWSSRGEIQELLAHRVGRAAGLRAEAQPENDYDYRFVLPQKEADGITRFHEIGQLSRQFNFDLRALWSLMDPQGRRKPSPTIRNLYLVGVTTVGLSDEQLSAARPPFNRSGLALAPVVKGFPTVSFPYRQSSRRYA